MNRILIILTFFCLGLLLISCEVKEQPIAYGQANCAHCQMTVSDKRYGAEMVSKTGKAYFFDSAECMISYLQENKEMNEKAKLLLVTDFSKPEKLTDARKAAFLQSKNLPSPMGMYLTAFASQQDAANMQQESGGRILNWEQAETAVKNNEKPQ